jgi:hypothetical protein
MPEQEQGAGEIEASEEITADGEGAEPSPPPAPLNREQRRAQAKGKKGGAAFNQGISTAPHMHGPGNIAGGGIRFQRKTGGK